MEKKILLKNGSVITSGNETQKRDILIAGGKIEKIGSDIHPEEQCTVYDLQGKLVTPGFIDVHVHLREPGMTHKETILTGSRAALKGGYTHIFAMPNVVPMPDTPEKMEDLYSRATESPIRVSFYSPITVGGKGEELVDFHAMVQAGAVAFTDDGRGVQNAGIMFQAMEAAGDLDKVITAHCEENSLIRGGYIHEGRYAKEHGHKGILRSCEDVQIGRDILLAGDAGAKYHICHMSTGRGPDLLSLGKTWGYKVSGEVTPHHLLLCDMDLKEDGNYRMNPPLRDESDREKLLDSLNSGIITVIATDHAPHTPSEKSKGLERSAFGIIGTENAFSLLYTKLVKTGKTSLETVIRAMTEGPAKVFGLKEGVLEEGAAADITVMDLSVKYTVDPSSGESKSENNPFKGEEVYGKTFMVLLNGEAVLTEGEINEKKAGS